MDHANTERWGLNPRVVSRYLDGESRIGLRTYHAWDVASMGGLGERAAMSLVRLRPENVAASAIEYASVTEQVALAVARLEGSGTPEETLYGVRYFRGGARTHMVVMSTVPRMVRFIDTIHAFEPDAGTRGFQL